jgi:hypothetical protein
VNFVKGIDTSDIDGKNKSRRKGRNQNTVIDDNNISLIIPTTNLSGKIFVF